MAIPKSNSERAGTFDDPFINIEDALLKADEAGAAYSNLNVTIYLTAGVHYVIAQRTADRYQRTQAKGELDRNYGLTIK